MRKSKKKIRPQGRLRPQPGGTTHLPKDIRQELGNPKTIPYVADANTVLFFREDKEPEEILESVDVLKQDLMLRIEDKKRGKKT